MADENKFGELKTTLIKAKTTASEDAAKAEQQRLEAQKRAAQELEKRNQEQAAKDAKE